MPTEEIHISPNKPVIVALVDPEGRFDFETGYGHYETTSGQTFTLPRPAVVILNMLAPKPGEEIVIEKHWSGRPGDRSQWTIALSTRSEVARAGAEDSQDLTATLEASIEAVRERKAIVATPTPISAPPRKREPRPETAQPRLFDRKGTGTDGPAVQPFIPPLVAASRKPTPGQIPANVAVREILAFIVADPNTANWSDQSRQDLASTIIIAAYKAGQVGLWERPE